MEICLCVHCGNQFKRRPFGPHSICSNCEKHGHKGNGPVNCPICAEETNAQYQEADDGYPTYS